MNDFQMSRHADEHRRDLQAEADRQRRGQGRPSSETHRRSVALRIRFTNPKPRARSGIATITSGFMTWARTRFSPLVTVVALVATAMVGGSLTTAAAGDQPVAAAAATTFTNTVAAPRGRLAWRKTELPSAGLAIEVNDVIATGSRFLAVGGGTADSSKPPKAKVWTSELGRVWRSVPLDGIARDGMMVAVTETTFGYVAVGWRGCCPVRAYVWLSPDGKDWERLPDQAVFRGALMRDVTTHDGDLFAVGCKAEFHCLSGRVWRSTDRGRTWKVVSEPPFIPESVASMGDQLIAVGATTGFDDARAVTATSPDGVSWKVGRLAGTPGSDYVVGRRWGQHLIGGGTRKPDGSLGKATLRRTPDGQKQFPISTKSFGRGRVLALDHVRRRTVLGGVRQTTTGVEKPFVWMTLDLERWVKGPLPTGSSGLGGIVHGVAISRNAQRVVAAGSTYDHRPAIWFGKIVR